MNTAIIVAAGSGSRFGSKTPKQFVELAGKPLILHTISKFQDCTEIDRIVLVVSKEQIASTELMCAGIEKLHSVVAGGETRAESVRNGIKHAGECEIVAVHDGARPLVSIGEISKTIEAARINGAACLMIDVADTIKKVAGDLIVETVERTELKRAATPQCFQREILTKAFDSAADFREATDECSLVEELGVSIAVVAGSSRNIKITQPEDILFAEALIGEARISEGKDMRIGFGNDIHRLVSDRPLIIGGIEVPAPFGAEGHSDADVLLHAITDSILGALGLGDIGLYFPADEEEWKDADSKVFLIAAADEIKRKGFEVSNLDCIVELEAPKLRPFVDNMRQNIASLLETSHENINIKCKTGEGLGDIGNGRAIKSSACVLLKSGTYSR